MVVVLLYISFAPPFDCLHISGRWLYNLSGKQDSTVRVSHVLVIDQILTGLLVAEEIFRNTGEREG